MRCFKEKDLILFYYQEIGKKKSSLLAEHLNTCSRCREEYKKIESLFAEAKADPVELTDQDLETIVQNIRGEIRKHSLSIALEDIVRRFFNGLAVILLRPRVIAVAAVLILALLLPSLIGKRDKSLDKEFDIFQTQMYISLDNIEGSIFELYEEASL